LEILGILIDGESVKGAIVDTDKGEILSEKRSIDAISDTRPHKLISKMHKIVKKFNWEGPNWCGPYLPQFVKVEFFPHIY
jgi:polyphosphate glucokinase